MRDHPEQHEQYQPHPLSDVWPQCYAAILELWRLARPAIDERAAARGVPLTLYDYAELGLATLSIAEVQRRDPYSRPAGFAAEFARLATDSWLEPRAGGDEADTRYTVLPHAREEVRGLIVAGDERLATLEVLPADDLGRLRGLLARLAAANLAAPEPPTRWATIRRLRVTTDPATSGVAYDPVTSGVAYDTATSGVAYDTAPLLGQVRELALDLFGYRDDAHIEAWRPHADPLAEPQAEGARWNAFTHVWSGEASSAAAIARAAAFRGYDAAFYAEALAALESRGWLASDGEVYRTTEAGQRLRDAVERQTDDWFYAPWGVLDGAALAELRALIARLLEALHAPQ